MNLQEKLEAYKADFTSRVPPETVRIMERATRELESSGILYSPEINKAGHK